MAVFDLIIEHGSILDGTGSAAYSADVGISDGSIAAIGDLKEAVAKRRLDATGLVVSPGFIDMHTHSDVILLADGRGESMIRQGVTTNVTGNCGYSAAPLTGPHREALIGNNIVFERGIGVDISWESFGQYVEVLQQAPKSINLALLVGHGTIRGAAMGLDARAPSEAELQDMQDLTRQALDEGAFGLSTGLITSPGMYSETSELVALAQVVAERDRLHSSHIRGESNYLVEAVTEALLIGRQSGVRTNISHHKAVGRDNWGKTYTTFNMIQEASQQWDLSYDMYPYTTCGGSLSQYPPPWAKAGGVPELYRRLVDPEQRPRIASGIVDGEADFPNFYRLHWEDIQVSYIPSEKNAWMEGLRIAEIAERLGKDPVELVMDLMVEEQDEIPVNQHVLRDEDVEFLLQQDLAMVGSDGAAMTPGGVTGVGRPHPRCYGSFARVLGHYVREKGLMPLEKAVHKMTGRPASVLGLKDRGLIRQGYAADLAVFDPGEIIDKATFTDPHQLAVGVRWVVVNGHLTLDDGVLAAELAGRVLPPN